MARYTGPKNKLARKVGEDLGLKTNALKVARRLMIRPGQHGDRGRRKVSDYGLQLQEKQKVKFIYGILEKQFRVYFQKAERTKGVTGEILLQLLERRIDNVAYKLRFATSRPQARQLVRHNHVYVNSKRVNIPSFLVKEGDELQVKGKEKLLKQVKDNIEMAAEREIPVWLIPDHNKLSGKILRSPNRNEITIPIQEELIVELYSK